MATSEERDNQIIQLFKHWKITTCYIAIVLTLILGLRAYEVFWE